MAGFVFEHIHLRSPDPEATAKFYERMFGARVIRTTQDGKPRVDVELGGMQVFIAAVPPDGKTAAAPVSPYQGLDHFGLTVTGIDNSPAMLAVAADNLAVLGVDNVQLAEGELDNLPLLDDSVDVAVANMVLHHAPDPARMLAEMARIVRPGGTIAVTDEVEHPYEWMRTEQADIWLGFTPEQVKGYFQQNRLAEYGHSSLGMQ